MVNFFFFQAEDGIRAGHVTGVQTCALPISVGVHADPFLQGTGGGGAEPAVDHERARVLPAGRSSGVGAGASAGLGVRIGSAVGLGQARPLPTGGPGTGALTVQGALGDGDLLGLAGLVGRGGVLAAAEGPPGGGGELQAAVDRKSTRLNSSHVAISYA